MSQVVSSDPTENSIEAAESLAKAEQLAKDRAYIKQEIDKQESHLYHNVKLMNYPPPKMAKLMMVKQPNRESKPTIPKKTKKATKQQKDVFLG
ncbi:uncharacterized protein MONOS_1150 [Monocercomonoides exilis]|uniref:uncharacterized protein n=1 Tax=Monocercomonoides exilis TaxID=2049356 RepID=UPI0035599713|nr:hypothetical protein MONOS_1150 [Monocercomonoides exilis]|eukprot:MONOS_1150.1-p1 / transcript=MONOS_1150.1 / gene=MONOS_1150 / organism=Monocercomonoides_exilis_PA203 / gene_product=unspecified product / transcript_product=unspecified product / location=Mono_scaffold00019:188002-188280(-) / protein_length=93 / sequence_SO=supercontig / SO=protein_coding / is_pseudo=false